MRKMSLSFSIPTDVMGQVFKAVQTAGEYVQLCLGLHHTRPCRGHRHCLCARLPVPCPGQVLHLWASKPWQTLAPGSTSSCQRAPQWRGAGRVALGLKAPLLLFLGSLSLTSLVTPMLPGPSLLAPLLSPHSPSWSRHRPVLEWPFCLMTEVQLGGHLSLLPFPHALPSHAGGLLSLETRA